MTELGDDAELAEQGVMALSGHRAPEGGAALYKRTDRQRSRAVREASGMGRGPVP